MSSVSSAPTYKSGSTSIAPETAASKEAVRGSALAFVSKLAAEVSGGTVDLPCFPDIVIRIRNTLSNPQTTMEQIVTVVGAEPRLAARLLQTANSAAFNTSGKTVSDLRSAVTRLGHALIQSAAMAYAVQQMKNEASLRPIAEQLSSLWRDCVIVASICKVVASRTRVAPDTAFLTGLLHGIGRLYIMVRSVDNPASKDADFQEMVSGWHASIGKAVLENWGFPEEMTDAVGAQDENNEPRRKHDADLADILVIGVTLAHTFTMPPPRKLTTAGIHAFGAISLTQEDCLKILKHAQLQLASVQDSLAR